MILLTSELHAALRANDTARRTAVRYGKREPDSAPVVRFFNPCGAAIWLASELHPDDDTLFGLADFGFGCPEFGTFSLAELASVRLPFGLSIERDLIFEGLFRCRSMRAPRGFTAAFPKPSMFCAGSRLRGATAIPGFRPPSMTRAAAEGSRQSITLAGSLTRGAYRRFKNRSANL